jgi:hypothetical protein
MHPHLKGIVIMKKRYLMNRDEIKNFVAVMFVHDKEDMQWMRAHIRKRVRKAGYGDNAFTYFEKCIDRLK